MEGMYVYRRIPNGICRETELKCKVNFDGKNCGTPLHTRNLLKVHKMSQHERK